MEGIGNALKSAREKSGVSIEEASKDINIKSVILENIESGSIGCFKNIYELKDYLEIYAKYLGLNTEHIMNEFNEYMFEYTSKIPLKEIEKKVMEQNKEKLTETVVSPYSKPMKKYPVKIYIIIYATIFALVIIIMIWSIFQLTSSKMTHSTTNTISFLGVNK